MPLPARSGSSTMSVEVRGKLPKPGANVEGRQRREEDCQREKVGNLGNLPRTLLLKVL
jgi:hypothetical protein